MSERIRKLREQIIASGPSRYVAEVFGMLEEGLRLRKGWIQSWTAMHRRSSSHPSKRRWDGGAWNPMRYARVCAIHRMLAELGRPSSARAVMILGAHRRILASNRGVPWTGGDEHPSGSRVLH